MEGANTFGIILGAVIVVAVIFLSTYKSKSEKEALLKKKLKYEEGKSEYELESLKHLSQISTNTNVIKVLLVLYAIITFISVVVIVSELEKY